MITIIIKFKPAYLDKVWGGSKLKELYRYNTSSNCGEAWGISAYKENSSIVIDGEFAGLTLKDLFAQKKELFGNYPSEEFPILVKVIDAKTDLSVQVHPNDKYAKKYYNSPGKTECWYILEAESNTNIIIGHKAKNKESIAKAIKKNDYDKILNKIPIKKNDMFKIPAGTIHAICANTVLLEVQQSSDLTFRFYDYNRLVNGQLRELHQKEALNVVKIPDNNILRDGITDYFSFKVISNKGSKHCTSDTFGDYFFIIKGIGMMNNTKVEKGDFVFISSKEQYEIKGDLKLAIINLK